MDSNTSEPLESTFATQLLVRHLADQRGKLLIRQLGANSAQALRDVLADFFGPGLPIPLERSARVEADYA